MKHNLRNALSLLLALAVLCGLLTLPVGAVSSVPSESAVSVMDEDDVDTINGGGAYVLSEASSGWYSADATELTIDTAEELAEFAAIVNGTSNDFAQDSFAGKTVTLGANIDLSGYGNWTPIGTVTVTSATGLGAYAVGTAFEGTFDGNGKTISNLSISSETGGVALFAYSTGTIRNLTVSGTVAGNYFTAGLVAVGSGVIENITVDVEVTASGNCVGGIMGDATGSLSIIGCHNIAAISTAVEASEKSTGRIAGIIGRVETGIDATIKECSNSANITGYQYVGGIIGGCFGNVSIDACYNSGNLTGISFGKVYLGGIAGKLEGGTISNCYNLGKVTDYHWSDGHIRAVGGITGCEENHSVGTAITNCYNAGTIELNTSNMTYGSKYIYMVGNISGGNSSTGANTMVYENCFYLEGAMAAQDPENESYQYWCDVYKTNPQAYDNEYITKCTDAELRSDEVLEILGESFQACDGAYPILYWQTGSAAPAPESYVIATNVSGGTARVNVEATAERDTVVSFTISGIEPGKQVKSVVVTDASGASVRMTENNGTYSFAMPARAVVLTVTLENTVADDAASYALTLPEDLDAIWTVEADSAYYVSGAVKAGATVAITVEKDQGAATTSFTGITVTQGETPVTVSTVDEKTYGGAKWYGEYTFTMPEGPVEVTLDAVYSDLKVYQRTSGSTALAASYTREQIEALGENNAAANYSGWSTETKPFIGKAETYVTLEQVLTASGLTLEEGDSLIVTAIDGFSLTYTYDYLIGTARYYYGDIFTNGASASDKTEFAPILTITTNFGTSQDEYDSMVCDTLNTYRFVFGQSESDLVNCTKIVDAMPCAITSLILVKGDGSGGESQPTVEDMNLVSATWDGISVDVSWYLSDPTADSYTIDTAAQFAGVAALVNGLVNEDCLVYTGDRVFTAAGWNNSDYVYDASGSSGQFNSATSEYWYGITRFEGVTVTLGADLDMSAGNYMPIGGAYLMRNDDTTTKVGGSFCGVLDGRYHNIIIACDRYCEINYGDGANIGLIGRLGVHDSDPEDWQPTGAAVRNIILYGSVKGNRSVGGIVGKVGKTVDTAVIENCANFASILGTDAKGTGGIAGASWNNSLVQNCYNAGTVTTEFTNAVGGITGSNEGTIKNCYNVGSVIGENTQTAAITSNNGGGVYEKCYWLTGSGDVGVFVSSAYDNPEIVEKTAEDMKDEDFVALLNQYAGGTIWAADSAETPINNGYPILAGQIPGANDGFAVTLDNRTGTKTPAVITGLTSGSVYNGSVTFNVACDRACAVAYTTDGGATYTRLTATANAGGGYDFTVNVTGTMEIVVAIKGDANGDGTVNVSDSMLINRACLPDTHAAYRALDALNACWLDMNGDGAITVSDTMQINRSCLPETHAAYQALPW